MRLQRVRDAVNRTEMQFIKWTAEGTFKGLPIGKLSICDAATCVNRRGYACILAMSVRFFSANQGGTADFYGNSPLTKLFNAFCIAVILSRAFLFQFRKDWYFYV